MEEMNISSNVEWKAPPRPVRYKRNVYDWNEIASKLKSNPNEWAVVASDVNPSVVTHIRRGRLKPFAPEGSFEASGQGRNENGYTKELYVRYVGGESASAEATAEEVLPATETASAPEYRVVSFNDQEPTPTASPANPTDFFNDPEL